MVFQLGGRITGHPFFYKPPDTLSQLRAQLLDPLQTDFDLDVRDSPRCGKESPIYVDVDSVGSQLEEVQPDEVLILAGLHIVFDIIDRPFPQPENFADATITFVGHNYLLGGTGKYGDPNGDLARQSILNAMKGDRRSPGLYIASGGDPVPYAQAELIMEVRAKTS
jgi:hypothetical protein